MGIPVFVPLRSALNAGPLDLQRPHTLDNDISDVYWLPHKCGRSTEYNRKGQPIFQWYHYVDAVKTAEYTETKKLIKKYGTRDPFEIMDQMNIVVGETSRYKTLKGYCFMSCKTIYVMISSFLSEEEKMIVAAHELGHIILHRSQLKMAPMQDDTLYNMTDNTEYQANLFAADLLIEDEDIEEMVQNEVRLIICRWRYRVISWRNNKGLKHSAIRKLSIYLTEVEYLC